MSLDDLFSQIQSGNMKELDIIVKADVQGSVEAVKQSLVKLSNEEVVVKVIHGVSAQSTNLMLFLLPHPMRSSSDLTFVQMQQRNSLLNRKA